MGIRKWRDRFVVCVVLVFFFENPAPKGADTIFRENFPSFFSSFISVTFWWSDDHPSQITPDKSFMSLSSSVTTIRLICLYVLMLNNLLLKKLNKNEIDVDKNWKWKMNEFGDLILEIIRLLPKREADKIRIKKHVSQSAISGLLGKDSLIKITKKNFFGFWRKYENIWGYF